MKKCYLIISLAAVLIIALSGSVAMAVEDFTGYEWSLEGLTVPEQLDATFYINQPTINAPYVLNVERRNWKDAIPLLVEGGTARTPHNSILVIRNLGRNKESELRFDSGAWDPAKVGQEDEFSFINSAIYTVGNEPTLRIKVGGFFGSDTKNNGKNASANSELRVKYDDGDVITEIVGDTDKTNAIAFVYGDYRGAEEYEAGRIYRPAGSDDLIVAVTDQYTPASLIDAMTFQAGTGEIVINSLTNDFKRGGYVCVRKNGTLFVANNRCP